MRRKDIIGIFDLDNSTVSNVTKSFLSRAEKNNKTVGINILPKSFILTGGGKSVKKREDHKDYKIYFSSNTAKHICKTKSKTPFINR